MTTPPLISVPAGYAPAFALGFSDAQSKLAIVSQNDPLPVSMVAVTPPAPLSGNTSASLLAGPYAAASGLPITVSLSGQWAGSIQLLRSTDGGQTRLALLIGGMSWGTFHKPGAEQAWIESEQGVSFYLDITLRSGTLGYRVSQ